MLTPLPVAGTKSEIRLPEVPFQGPARPVQFATLSRASQTRILTCSHCIPSSTLGMKF